MRIIMNYEKEKEMAECLDEIISSLCHETWLSKGGRSCNPIYGDVTFYSSVSQHLPSWCYKLVQGFRVTSLFTGQYNTNGYDMTADVI